MRCLTFSSCKDAMKDVYLMFDAVSVLPFCGLLIVNTVRDDDNRSGMIQVRENRLGLRRAFLNRFDQLVG